MHVVYRNRLQWMIGAAMAAGILGTSIVARADDDHEGGWRHHRHRHYVPYYVVVPSRPVRYYAPPPVIYAPPPMVVYPDAPTYYAPYSAPAPSININIPLQ